MALSPVAVMSNQLFSNREASKYEMSALAEFDDLMKYDPQPQDALDTIRSLLDASSLDPLEVETMVHYDLPFDDPVMYISDCANEMDAASTIVSTILMYAFASVYNLDAGLDKANLAVRIFDRLFRYTCLDAKRLGEMLAPSSDHIMGYSSMEFLIGLVQLVMVNREAPQEHVRPLQQLFNECLELGGCLPFDRSTAFRRRPPLERRTSLWQVSPLWTMLPVGIGLNMLEKNDCVILLQTQEIALNLAIKRWLDFLRKYLGRADIPGERERYLFANSFLGAKEYMVENEK